MGTSSEQLDRPSLVHEFDLDPIFREFYEWADCHWPAADDAFENRLERAKRLVCRSRQRELYASSAKPTRMPVRAERAVCRFPQLFSPVYRRRDMTIERVAVTGGNGRIGTAILEAFGEHDYHTVDLARGKRREEVADEYRTTDLLDAGEVYGALAASDADAVVHMGTIPSPRNHAGHTTFESNAMSAYNVLEAASALDLDAVVLPSSINVMGADFQEAQTEVSYLPVDEDHPLTPRDPYALGKRTTEVLGAGFARRPDTPQVASLRYPWVATSEELRAAYAEGDRSLSGLRESDWNGRSTLFSYLHVEDAAAVARRAIEADLDGHEAFWAVAADTNATVPSGRLATEIFPSVEVRGELDEHESLISIAKARDLLDWEPERSWRNL